MSSVLSFDIIAEIIDIVGDNNDTNLLKELALVSHSFLQICSKHLFATIELHDALPMYHLASSKRGFLKLLQNRPSVVKYIRKLTYREEYKNSNLSEDDRILFPFLPDLLRTIPRLNCLIITASRSLKWDSMDPSLTSAFLHLMHLPTINHIDLSYIRNFPMSGLIPCVNLHRLNLTYVELEDKDDDDFFPVIVQSETMPKICEFHTSRSTELTTMLLYAERQDGRPAFDFTDLRQLSMHFDPFNLSKDEHNFRYLSQNAKLLEKLHLLISSVVNGFHGFRHTHSSVGLLHNILSPIACTLKALDLTDTLPLSVLCEELKTMAGNYTMLEVLSIQVKLRSRKDILELETVRSIGFSFQELEEVLVKPGWSGLRQISFKVSIPCCGVSGEDIAQWSEELQSLPNKYLSRISKLESVAFNYSFDVAECQVPWLMFCDRGCSERLPEPEV